MTEDLEAGALSFQYTKAVEKSITTLPLTDIREALTLGVTVIFIVLSTKNNKKSPMVTHRGF
jgi:hypothetical protein